jgi:phosphoglycerate dehydrogenase-like enzyme
MRVVGVSRTDRPVDGIDRIYAREQLAEAAAEVDYLVLTVPLDDSTRGIVDARVLGSMKPTAFLINLARGGNVDTDALVEALRRGGIAGASLDGFEPEPLPVESPLWELDNVMIAAHMGGRSDRYVAEFLKVFEPNLGCWLDGNLAAMTNVVQR